MNAWTIAGLILSALQTLEGNGTITLGGFDKNSVEEVLTVIEGLVTHFQTNQGLGGQSTPPGTQSQQAPSTSNPGQV